MNRNTLTKSSWKSVIAFGFIITTLITACGDGGNQASSYQEQSVVVETIIVTAENLPFERSYPTQIEGKVNIELRPQVSGYIETIYVDEGAFVKAGQPIFKINASVYQEQKNTALAALSAANAQLQNAQLELEKYQKLTERKIVSDFQYQKAKAAYESATANIEQQKALVASADLNIGFSTVKAPVSGYVGRIPNRIGALVSPADAQALTTLSQVDVVYAYFSIPEVQILDMVATRKGNSLIEKLKNYGTISLRLANGTVYEKTGKIDIVDGQYDKGTASIPVRASFANPNGILRSGNTGKILLTDTLTQVVKIPVLATVDIQDKVFIGIVNDSNVVTRMPLKDYVKSGDYYLVKSGIEPGTRIVSTELAKVPEKATVTIK
ncbi:efflux RND transporter periplasmic adaptor subunit [Gynurincola endophyticus]|uniref:efflux RND transporter periplasmic adaptor subunit n=1 Tax=Gynurincola endophyticus TaxID=2479004 RepID=UPI000F8DF588|nr:efflux RND transporter periplasmic adaptor subunit [Gynurincola endophyticus]